MSDPREINESAAQQSLARHGKSFWLASLFLPSSVATDAAIVYRFCRTVDDAVDESQHLAAARKAVDRMRHLLDQQEGPSDAIRDYRAVATRLQIPNEAPAALISGVRSDLASVRIRSLRELGSYAYRVAGVVGQMMAHVLRIRSPRALSFAIDLGMAMQITNICRDVMEDARRNRVYLPADLLLKHGLTASDVVCRTASDGRLGCVIDELLDAAETLYQRAEFGMKYIPFRSRLGIFIALRLYRDIGRKLRTKHDSNPFHGRTMLTVKDKLSACVFACGDFIRSINPWNSDHAPVASPFGCQWQQLAARCRLDDELSETDFGSVRRFYNVAS